MRTTAAACIRWKKKTRIIVCLWRKWLTVKRRMRVWLTSRRKRVKSMLAIAARQKFQRVISSSGLYRYDTYVLCIDHLAELMHVISLSPRERERRTVSTKEDERPFEGDVWKELFPRESYQKPFENSSMVKRWQLDLSYTFNRFGWTISKFIPRFLLGASCFPTLAFIRRKCSLLRRTRLIARHFLKDPSSIWRALFPFPAIFYPFFPLRLFFYV